MGFEVFPSDDGRYLIMNVTGDVTRQLAMEYNVEAHKTGRAMGINRFLVDMTESTNVDSILDNYEFAYKDMKARPEIDNSAVVAVLVRPDDHSHDFIETVARNAHLNVTLYRDRDAAIAALLAAD